MQAGYIGATDLVGDIDRTRLKMSDEQEDPEVLVVFRGFPPLFYGSMDTKQPLKMHHALTVQMVDFVWLLS